MDLISLALRFEIGIAFAFFPLPISIFIGIAFSITNELAVKYCKVKSTIFNKASVLFLFTLLNTIIFSIGAFFRGKFIMHEGTKHAFVSLENIKYYFYAVFYFALALLVWRMLFLGITVLIQINTKPKDKDQTSKTKDLT